MNLEQKTKEYEHTIALEKRIHKAYITKDIDEFIGATSSYITYLKLPIEHMDNLVKAYDLGLYRGE